MKSTIAIQVAGLVEEMRLEVARIQRELCELERAGHGHARMRDLCEQLDSLESSLCWDLEAYFARLGPAAASAAARIIHWLRDDLEPLGQLVCRLDNELPGQPLVTTAMLACGELVAQFMAVDGGLLSDFGQVMKTSIRSATWRWPENRYSDQPPRSAGHNLARG